MALDPNVNVVPPSPGDLVFASWGDRVSESVVQHFDTIADRAKWDTPPPTKGAVCSVAGKDLYVWNGSKWLPVGVVGGGTVGGALTVNGALKVNSTLAATKNISTPLDVSGRNFTMSNMRFGGGPWLNSSGSWLRPTGWANGTYLANHSTLGGRWSNVTGKQRLQWRKRGDMVDVRFNAWGGASISGKSRVFQLPAGYRPPATFDVAGAFGGQAQNPSASQTWGGHRFLVEPNGVVTAYGLYFSSNTSLPPGPGTSNRTCSVSGVFSFSTV